MVAVMRICTDPVPPFIMTASSRGVGDQNFAVVSGMVQSQSNDEARFVAQLILGALLAVGWVGACSPVGPPLEWWHRSNRYVHHFSDSTVKQLPIGSYLWRLVTIDSEKENK
jgi:hypothetical protein